MSEAVFRALLEAARRLYLAHPELTAFCEWPEDLVWAGRAAEWINAAAEIEAWQENDDTAEAQFHRAVQAVARYAAWMQTYTEAEVGKYFLEHYGYFEIFGPGGHFRTGTARAFVSYWGEGLEYGWHRHDAEEIYLVVSGGGLFYTDGEADAVLGPGETRLHASNQPHALDMIQGPILTLVFWRGAGLDDLPRMGLGTDVS